MSSKELLTPLQRYQRDLATSGFQQDRAQAQAVQHLQRLYDDLVAIEERPSEGLLSQVMRWFGGEELPAVKGLYLWGGVGRGKTYLMDTFYDCLPFERKLRTHFHRFMQRVHAELTHLEGKKNPLDQVAAKLATEARVICFDEFFVTDITDAMILGGLFEKLFESGVVLVATSNIIPDGLYEDGLQRQRFLPAIRLLNECTEVINVDAGVDYRLRTLEQASLYLSPADTNAEQALHEVFVKLAPDIQEVQEQGVVEINGRELQFRRSCEDVIWFDFAELCDGPRSQNDYIELAKLYHSVIVSNVPVLTTAMEDQARRFINLVDEFYDSSVKLILSAEPALGNIYQGQRLAFEFQRTGSRLIEMQSTEYLARAHRA